MSASGISEFLMMLLCILSAPADKKEFSVDAIRSTGQVESILVQRDDSGFVLLASKDPDTKPVPMGNVRPVPGKPASFTLKFADKPEQTFDVLTVFSDFTAEAVKKEQKLDLKSNDGETLHLRRSGGVTYLILDKAQKIYTSH